VRLEALCQLEIQLLGRLRATGDCALQVGIVARDGAFEIAELLRTQWGVEDPIAWQQMKPNWWGADLIPGDAHLRFMALGRRLIA
jgi:hypothetical protein